MPIYEYRCQSCGHELERIQRMNDEYLTDCPDCGAAELRRLVSAAAFRLKGAGWYETDFKKDGKKNLHDSGETSADSNAGSESSEPKSDPSAAKPEPSAARETAKPADSKKAESKPASNKSDSN